MLIRLKRKMFFFSIISPVTINQRSYAFVVYDKGEGMEVIATKGANIIAASGNRDNWRNEKALNGFKG